MIGTVLIVDDEKNTREGLRGILEERYDVYEARDAEEAFRLMGEEEFDVVLTDLRMAGKSGMKVIDRAMELKNKPICIMMTAYGNVETAVEAMKRGAFDFLTKPVNVEKLEILVERALRSRRLEEENEELHERLEKEYKWPEEIIGKSGAIRKVVEEVRLVAGTKATVLLEGETGTGKELFAQMIHQNSGRAKGPFVAVHCAALASNLLESELFGHEKGAFTGAVEKRMGRFEAANGGTLFLDEIGEIDATVQIKLLRFLETRGLERVGSHKVINVDVRLICATNRDLEGMVKEGTFREDLYYRLNVVKVKLPALRERKEDIEALLEYYIRHYSRENGLRGFKLNGEVVEVLRGYGWPGNIRELRNFCENLVVTRRGEGMTVEKLEGRYRGEVVEGGGVGVKEKKMGTLLVEENKRELLEEALKRSGGNRTEAAKLLGISRRTLHRQLLKYGL